MQRIKLYLSRINFGSYPRYKFTKKGGYVASSIEYAYIKKVLCELTIIESEKAKFEDIILSPVDICKLLEEGLEVFIV